MCKLPALAFGRPSLALALACSPLHFTRLAFCTLFIFFCSFLMQCISLDTVVQCPVLNICGGVNIATFPALSKMCACSPCDFSFFLCG